MHAPIDFPDLPRSDDLQYVIYEEALTIVLFEGKYAYDDGDFDWLFLQPQIDSWLVEHYPEVRRSAKSKHFSYTLIFPDIEALALFKLKCL
jgi:hypothetical protein